MKRPEVVGVADVVVVVIVVAVVVDIVVVAVVVFIEENPIIALSKNFFIIRFHA